MTYSGLWSEPIVPSARQGRGITAPMRLVVLAGLMFSLSGASAALQQPASTPAKPGAPIRNTPPRPAPGTPGAQPARPATAPGNPFPANQPPAAVPIGQPGVQPAQPAQPLQPVVMPEGFKPEMTATSLKFGPFAEPVQVRLLVDLVAQALNLQIMDVGLALQDKKVSLITQIEVPKKDLLSFLNLLLEQNGQTITRDVAGVFMIRPFGEFGGGVGADAFASTRIIPTPGLKPSSLQAAISVAVRGGPPGQNQAAPSIAYLDDLGVILVTDSPRRIQQLEELIVALVKQQNDVQWLRIPVRYLSASDARTRVLELLGRVAQNTGGGFNANIQPGQPVQVPNINQQGAAGGTLASISNLPERLLVSNDSNDLLFRGQSDEILLLNKALETVDVASSLKGQFFNVGGAAQAIASIASSQGLGSVQTFQNGNNLNAGGNAFANLQGQQALQFQGFNTGQNHSDAGQGGSRFVIDGQGRGFMYYGTAEQLVRLQQIVDEYAPLLDSERVTYEFYRLRHGKAESIAEIVRGLISNQVPTGGGDGSAFLPTSGNTGVNRVNTQNANRRTTQAINRAVAQATGQAAGTEAIEDTQDVFVLQYKDTNTVVVKAPARLQPQFKNLIDKLDQRRPQVYIDAKIVVVTGSDDVRLAVETQLVNAGGTGGVLRTIFPTSPTQTSTTSGNIIVPPVVSPLTGFTAALIRSDMTPLVITAIQNLTDARVVASPKLLVDDNEEASIISKEQRPTSTQTQVGGTGSNNVLTGFGGYEDAGPELTVTPQISSGDYLRLKYKLNLSNFIGEASGSNPPPKQNNEISSDSVTIPSDSTIVVGGLTFDQTRKTVVQVPLVGDIPIIGQLFKDERDVKTTSVIYVFITPRIMRDEQFEDLRLLSKGPMKASKIKDELPDPTVSRMEIHRDPDQPPSDLQFIERRREDSELPPPRSDGATSIPIEPPPPAPPGR